MFYFLKIVLAIVTAFQKEIVLTYFLIQVQQISKIHHFLFIQVQHLFTYHQETSLRHLLCLIIPILNLMRSLVQQMVLQFFSENMENFTILSSNFINLNFATAGGAIYLAINTKTRKTGLTNPIFINEKICIDNFFYNNYIIQ